MTTDSLTDGNNSIRERLIEISPALLLGITPFVFLDIGGEFENLPKMAVLQCGIVVIALMRLRRSVSIERWTAAWWLGVAIVLFFLSCCSSLVWAEVPVRAVVPLVHLGCAVILYFVMANGRQPVRSARAIVYAGAVGCALISLIGIGQALLGLDLIPQVIPPAATLANRNAASHFVAMCLPFGVAAPYLARHWILRSCLAASPLIAMWYLYLARTRAAWLAVEVLLVLAPLAFVLTTQWGRRSKIRKLVHLSLALVVVAGAAALALGVTRLAALDTREAGTSYADSALKLGSGTIKSRVACWNNTMAMVADHFPAGVGFANFAVVYPLYHDAVERDWNFTEDQQIQRAHNDHLQILAELGLPGFAGYSFMLLLCLGLCLRLQLTPRVDVARLSLPFGLAIVSILVSATFSFPLERAIVPVFLLASMGVLASLSVGTRTGRSGTSSSRFRMVMALGLVLYVSIAGYAMRRSILSQWQHHKAERLIAVGSFEDGNKRLARARDLCLWCPEVSMRLAQRLAMDGRLAEASTEIKRALRHQPHRLNALLNLGSLNIRLGKYDEAKDQLDRALALMPDSLRAHSSLGMWHFSQSQFETSLPYFERVVDLAQQRPRGIDDARLERQVLAARMQMGAGYAELGRYQAAAEQYGLALEIDPSRDDVRDAIERLVKAIQISP